MSIRAIILCLVTAIFMGGCAKQEWWVGKWTVDQERTTKNLSGSSDKKDFLSGLMGGLTSLALDGLVMNITSNEVMVTKGGSGEVKSYKIMERPSADSVVLRIGDKITTFKKEGDEISETVPMGVVQMRVYYKRMDQKL